MATWGLKRQVPVRDRKGWWFMLWENSYVAGRGYHPLAGDQLKVWDGAGNVYSGTIHETHSFLYSSHGEVKLALGGVREQDSAYLANSPTEGWCVAVRAELNQTEPEPCPHSGRASWFNLPGTMRPGGQGPDQSPRGDSKCNEH